MQQICNYYGFLVMWKCCNATNLQLLWFFCYVEMLQCNKFAIIMVFLLCGNVAMQQICNYYGFFVMWKCCNATNLQLLWFFCYVEMLQCNISTIVIFFWMYQTVQNNRQFFSGNYLLKIHLQCGGQRTGTNTSSGGFLWYHLRVFRLLQRVF